LNQAALSILSALGAFDAQLPEAPRSGEALREQLGISRTQVWKHIEQLRERGYDIEGNPGGGYLLKGRPDRLYPELIHAGLRTQAFGRVLETFDLVDSTNRVAAERAREGAAHGATIIAEGQTEGRGRLGRNFFSPSYQNLYVSIVLRPKLTAEAAPSVVLSCATAVAEAIAREVANPTDVSIKWPNDVLLGGKKTSGILLEMRTEGAQVAWLVLGIGINLNMPRNDFPEEFRSNATSLSSYLGKRIDRVLFTRRLLETLEEVLDSHAAGGFEAVRPRFDRRFPMLNKRVTVREVAGQPYSGRVLDIDGDGALRLVRDDGELVRVLAGDVTLADGLGMAPEQRQTNQ